MTFGRNSFLKLLCPPSLNISVSSNVCNQPPQPPSIVFAVICPGVLVQQRRPASSFICMLAQNGPLSVRSPSHPEGSGDTPSEMTRKVKSAVLLVRFCHWPQSTCYPGSRLATWRGDILHSTSTTSVCNSHICHWQSAECLTLVSTKSSTRRQTSSSIPHHPPHPTRMLLTEIASFPHERQIV